MIFNSLKNHFIADRSVKVQSASFLYPVWKPLLKANEENRVFTSLTDKEIVSAVSYRATIANSPR
jgi:hypothetical protein